MCSQTHQTKCLFKMSAQCPTACILAGSLCGAPWPSQHCYTQVLGRHSTYHEKREIWVEIKALSAQAQGRRSLLPMGRGHRGQVSKWVGKAPFSEGRDMGLLKRRDQPDSKGQNWRGGHARRTPSSCQARGPESPQCVPPGEREGEDYVSGRKRAMR